MKARVKPGRSKTAAAAALVSADNLLSRAVASLTEYLIDPRLDEPRLFQFNDDEVAAIHLIARKQAQLPFDVNAFVRAMDDTEPVLARPRLTDRATDLWRMLSQPELVNLWSKWNGRTGTRGRDPGYFAKALLTVAASLGSSAHFDDNYDQLTGHNGEHLRQVFEWLETTAASQAGRERQPFAPKSYEKALEQIRLLVDQNRNSGLLSTDLCISANTTLLKWLSVTYPTTGRMLGIDAMLIPAWIKQVPRRSPEQERKLRERAPHATPRAIAGRGGAPSRFARGYYLVAITDIATNLPVVWGLWGAGEGFSERTVLRYLLNDLFEMWPDCPTTHIVADRAWDNVEAIKDCAVQFGIHLIVGRDEPSWNRRPTILSEIESRSIASFDGKGIAYCRRHGVAMRRAGHSFVGRGRRNDLGLRQGDPSNAKEFRLRFECPEGCEGKPHLHMDRDWAALSHYPHTIDGGREDLHALRLALYARRNSCEALFASLKLGQKLGLSGATRTHTSNEGTVETLLSLGLLLRTAFVVACERLQQAPAESPPI
jgi:hypothetical protein